MQLSDEYSNTCQTTKVVSITTQRQTGYQNVMGHRWGLDSVKTKQGVQGDSYDFDWYIHLSTFTNIHFSYTTI